jgi:hypothetical protein
MIATISTNGHAGAKAKTAQAPGKPKAKAKPPANVEKPRVSRAKSNGVNVQESTGPRTEPGKAAVRSNEVRHEMTAESLLLPSDTGGEFEARRRRLLAELAPRNVLEATMIDHIARDAWMSARAERAAAAQLAYRVRHDRRERAYKEQAQVIKLGQRLLKDVARPSGVTPDEHPGGLRHPARLLVRLESKLAGCEWLLGRLRQLKDRALAPGLWLKNDGYELIRLLGKHRDELPRDDQIAFVVLASECVFEDSANAALADAAIRDQALAAAEAKAELEANGPPPGREQRQAKLTKDRKNLAPTPAYDEYEALQAHVTRPARVLAELAGSRPQQTTIGHAMLPFQRLNPPSVAEARRRLVLVIDEQIARLERLHAEHVEVAHADAADAAARLALQLGPDGDRQRDHILNRDRLLNQTIQMFLKLRIATDAGTLDADFPIDGGLAEGDEFDLRFDSQIDSERASRFGDAYFDRTADPSLVHRASMSAAAFEDRLKATDASRKPGAKTSLERPNTRSSPTDTEAETQTRSFGGPQGGPKREQGSEVIHESVAQLIARAIRERIDYGDEADLRNRADAASSATPVRAGCTSRCRPEGATSLVPLITTTDRRPEVLVAGTAPMAQLSGDAVRSSRTPTETSGLTIQADAVAVPSGAPSAQERSTGGVALAVAKASSATISSTPRAVITRVASVPAIALPTVSSPTTAVHSPIIQLHYLPLDFPWTVARERWNALPPDVIETVEAIQNDFRRATHDKHLDERTIARYRDYIRKHLS